MLFRLIRKSNELNSGEGTRLSDTAGQAPYKLCLGGKQTKYKNILNGIRSLVSLLRGVSISEMNQHFSFFSIHQHR